MPRRKIKGAKSDKDLRIFKSPRGAQSDRDLKILSNMTVAKMTFGAESDKDKLLRKLKGRRGKSLLK